MPDQIVDEPAAPNNTVGGFVQYEICLNQDEQGDGFGGQTRQGSRGIDP
jgi:hypothetical protein